MNKNAKERVQKLFDGMKSSLSGTDPEFVEIITNFSQDETVSVSRLTEKEQMLCILSALLGCQGLGEFQNMLHAALNAGLDPVAVKEVIYQGQHIWELAAFMIFLSRQIRSWNSMGYSCRFRDRAQWMRKPGLGTDSPSRLICSALLWRNGRRRVRPCAGISTAGWRLTVLVTTIPGTV